MGRQRIQFAVPSSRLLPNTTLICPLSHVEIAACLISPSRCGIGRLKHIRPYPRRFPHTRPLLPLKGITLRNPRFRDVSHQHFLTSYLSFPLFLRALSFSWAVTLSAEQGPSRRPRPRERMLHPCSSLSSPCQVSLPQTSMSMGRLVEMGTLRTPVSKDVTGPMMADQDDTRVCSEIETGEDKSSISPLSPLL